MCQLLLNLLALRLDKLKLLYVAVPSRAPVLISVKALNSTSVEVQWELVPEQFARGMITKYVIFYTAEKKTDEMEVLAPLLRAVVNGLRQSRTYSFRVRAETVKGGGPKSDPKNRTTEGKEK